MALYLGRRASFEFGRNLGAGGILDFTVLLILLTVLRNSFEKQIVIEFIILIVVSINLQRTIYGRDQLINECLFFLSDCDLGPVIWAVFDYRGRFRAHRCVDGVTVGGALPKALIVPLVLCRRFIRGIRVGEYQYLASISIHEILNDTLYRLGCVLNSG
eukprot:scaffold41737_cov97-Cyclotella_meneghiniana.AAC.1